MSDLQRMRRPIDRQRLIGGALRLLNRFGVRINPFLVVEEAPTSSQQNFGQDDLTLVLAARKDIDQLLNLQPGHIHESLNEWFDAGRLCFVAKDKEQIVALMWADLDSFNYPPNYRKLAAHEAYLFAAVSDPEYRGKNVAPALRLFCYETLRQRGISKFYSYTDYLNVAARRFKAKLNARERDLRVHVDLWGLWSRTFTLRRYD